MSVLKPVAVLTFCCDFKMQSYHGGETVSVVVRRTEDFEQGCADLFRRGMLPVTRLLEELSECF
jgi:hypothetical protein